MMSPKKSPHLAKKKVVRKNKKSYQAPTSSSKVKSVFGETYLQKSRAYQQEQSVTNSVQMNISKLTLTLKSEKGKLLSPKKKAKATVKPIASAKERVKEIETAL